MCTEMMALENKDGSATLSHWSTAKLWPKTFLFRESGPPAAQEA